MTGKPSLPDMAVEAGLAHERARAGIPPFADMIREIEDEIRREGAGGLSLATEWLRTVRHDPAAVAIAEIAIAEVGQRVHILGEARTFLKRCAAFPMEVMAALVCLETVRDNRGQSGERSPC